MQKPTQNFGEVFTKRWAVDLILDLVGYTADKPLTTLTLVEPAIGSGAFLRPIVERLLDSQHGTLAPAVDLMPAISAFDIQPAHVATCRRIVVEMLTSAGYSVEDAHTVSEAWVRCADFLLDEVPTQADFVVGNPPYIRNDDIPAEMQMLYRSHWSTMRGRCDIYVGFFERGLRLLKPNGKLGFICADRWMRNAYGKSLRSLVATSYAMEAVLTMHDVDAFDSMVSAYPAITVLANKTQEQAVVVETTESFGPTSAEDFLAFYHSPEGRHQGNGWKGTRLPSWFETDDFWPTGDPDAIALLEYLQENFLTLESDGATTIGIGVATGADKAYLVDVQASEDIEPSRLLPIVMANDIRSGTLGATKKLLVNPWDENGVLVNIDDYPRMKAHLLSSDKVQSRFVAKKNPKQWHRTIDKVKPGLAASPKLLLQDMKARITPVLEPGGLYPHHNLYYITSSTWDLEVLAGILLSDLAEMFIRSYAVTMRGGTLRFQAQYLRKIAVPAPASIGPETAKKLKLAFRNSDRTLATEAAFEAYDLPHEFRWMA
ncbi:Eco57I restriction-modification methylase domain-containing protein [Corynebacterium sp. MSK105]|uniref:Eco57I restriction-modification methylase domain-containing protein n=1 Tax=unclassified Corynebacterium TaxID=2624378 RepID=UPI00254E5710|nr:MULTISPECIES: Eco57I restriction-modification methylase domain-containing protein [unclassified Corynebacterium]MDK8483681.1 Eco57I restriction-modification methylase domain-containing protein [Corynebacterium sp. MSK074]MDK8691116.1 Eco57I restriction-modification methylase domain-containing protein [Corynebacterium sp. MSK105]